jgi:magnesium chelatase subunit D
MLPFPALIGLDAARQALLLLAVDPGLGGVVLAAGVGTGKSTLMRSFARFLGTTTFVELPVGVTEDRLLGGLDLEATLASGTRVHRSGLMAAADGGLLYADNVNLLDDSTTNHILAAFDSRMVRIERDGLSVEEPSTFSLLATYDPNEGQPRRHLMDRVGLIVAPIGKANAPSRAEVVRRNLEANRAMSSHSSKQKNNQGSHNGNAETNGYSSLASWMQEEQMLIELIEEARDRLPSVQITDEQIEKLAATALVLGVEGHRADIFATRAALASAALADRDCVEEEDLERATRYVLLPRATRAPQFEQEEEQQAPPEQTPTPPDQQQDDDDDQQDDQQDEDQEDQPPPPPEELQAIEDMILSALDTEIPPDILDTPFTIRRSGRSGSRGSTSGQRGRHIRSVQGEPGQGRLDVIATLRAAAPWQRIRKKQAKGKRKRSQAGTRRSPVHLRAEDLHIKKYRSKAGTLFCFLVDASGSMALHRMRQAKGAVNALLQQAYVHRDQVALLSFRGEQADILMPPSQSVELAKRALDVLPTGGGTPLSAALLSAFQVAEQAQSRGIHRTTLVIITDGKPNVPLNFDPSHSREQRLSDAREEVEKLSGKLRAAGIGSVVIDTQRNFISRGEAQQLARWLGGSYFYLPQGRGEDIANAVLAADQAE